MAFLGILGFVVWLLATPAMVIGAIAIADPVMASHPWPVWVAIALGVGALINFCFGFALMT